MQIINWKYYFNLYLFVKHYDLILTLIKKVLKFC